MTILLPTPNPVDTVTHTNEPVHITCCQDDTVSLCGVRGTEWFDMDAGVNDCVVCDDLDRSGTCPLYGYNGCRGEA